MSPLKPSLLLCLGLAASLHAQEGAPLPPAVALDAADFPSIQAALNALPASGGILRLPPGTTEIREPLVLSSPETRIEGSGASTHIKNLNEEGKPALIIRPKTLDTDREARLWRVQLADLRISGSEKSGDGIFAECIQEIYLEGVSIDHHGGHGIHLKSCFEDPRIADCILTYNKKCGIEILDCHDIVVNANHFEENQDALHCADSFNLCMNGNNIDDHLGHGIIIENTYGSIVSRKHDRGMQRHRLILDRDCYGITLSANVIAHDLEGGIDLRDAHGITVSANTFTLMHHFGVRVSEKSGRITISANNFQTATSARARRSGSSNTRIPSSSTSAKASSSKTRNTSSSRGTSSPAWMVRPCAPPEPATNSSSAATSSPT
jgi:parallel beta-helix repeat protein